MKKIYNKVIATVGLVAICTTAAEATPAFARQMNADCMTCHYQNIPKLNSFGREFKLSGFTMTGGVKEIISNANGGVAIPSTLNMGFVIKARSHDTVNGSGTSGDDAKRTEIYDESAFVFGGKIGESTGVSLEFGAGLLGGKIITSEVTDAGRFGLAIHMTDALGVFAGLETYSTGLYRPVRQFENRKGANIFQKLGIGDGEAQGVQAYYSGHGLFVTVGQYIPVFSPSTDTEQAGHKTFARLAYELDVSGLNIALGGYYIGGDVKKNDAFNQSKTEGVDADALDRESTGLDIQIQGDVAKMPLMLTGGYVLSNEYTGGLDGASPLVGTDRDRTGFSTAVQVNPIDTLGLKVAYLSYTDNKVSDNDLSTISIGTDYNAAQNLRLVLEYSMTDYAAANTTAQDDLYLMLQTAF